MRAAMLRLGTFCSRRSLNEQVGSNRTAPMDPAVIGQNFAYRDWYKGVADGWKPYVSEVYRTRAAPQQLAVAVAVPVGGHITAGCSRTVFVFSPVRIRRSKSRAADSAAFRASVCGCSR